MCRSIPLPREGVIHQGRATPGQSNHLAHAIRPVFLVPDTIIFLRGSFHHRVTSAPPSTRRCQMGCRILFMTPPICFCN